MTGRKIGRKMHILMHVLMQMRRDVNVFVGNDHSGLIRISCSAYNDAQHVIHEMHIIAEYHT